MDTVPSYPWFSLHQFQSLIVTGSDNKGRMCVYVGKRRDRGQNRDGRQPLNSVIRHCFLLLLVTVTLSLLKDLFIFIYAG